MQPGVNSEHGGAEPLHQWEVKGLLWPIFFDAADLRTEYGVGHESVIVYSPAFPCHSRLGAIDRME